MGVCSTPAACIAHLRSWICFFLSDPSLVTDRYALWSLLALLKGLSHLYLALAYWCCRCLYDPVIFIKIKRTSLHFPDTDHISSQICFHKSSPYALLPSGGDKIKRSIAFFFFFFLRCHATLSLFGKSPSSEPVMRMAGLNSSDSLMGLDETLPYCLHGSSNDGHIQL